jgi:hypothetical protein
MTALRSLALMPAHRLLALARWSLRMRSVTSWTVSPVVGRSDGMAASWT